jgi:hypothetical protein
MKTFYVEFKTWAEGKIEVPWSYVIFEETNDYRNRQDLSIHVNKKTIASVFGSLDETVLKNFFDKNINAFILGSVISAANSDSVLQNLKKYFGYCEILGICEISDMNRDRINKIMADAKV